MPSRGALLVRTNGVNVRRQLNARLAAVITECALGGEALDHFVGVHRDQHVTDVRLFDVDRRRQVRNVATNGSNANMRERSGQKMAQGHKERESCVGVRGGGDTFLGPLESLDTAGRT